MINEDIYYVSGGIRNESERLAYLYGDIEKKHKYRFLFDPLRLLNQTDFIKSYINGDNPFPWSIEVDPTNFCNHDCPFCIYSSLHRASHKERMPDEVLFNIISEAYELGTRSILFIGGGEPLSHSKTVDACVYAKELGLSVGVVTNGGIVKPRDTSKLKNYTTYIRISLDAGSAQTHREMHHSGDFNQVIANMKALSSKPRAATIGVSYFISAINVHEASKTADLVKSLGADYIQFKTYAGIGIEQTWYDILLQEIEKAILLSDDNFDVYVMDNLFDTNTFQARTYSKCHWQAFKTIINADGNVYLCTQKRGKQDSIIGNIYHQTLKEIWQGDQRKEVVKSILLSECPYCVHHNQNRIIEFLSSTMYTHKGFY